MPQYSLDKPCIRISSRYEGSPLDMNTHEEKTTKKKEKWLGKNDFRTVGG